MRESDLLLLSPVERRELCRLFASAYISCRGNCEAQDQNLKVLDGLANLWNLTEEEQDQWHRIAAVGHENIRNFWMISQTGNGTEA